MPESIFAMPVVSKCDQNFRDTGRFRSGVLIWVESSLAKNARSRSTATSSPPIRATSSRTRLIRNWQRSGKATAGSRKATSRTGSTASSRERVPNADVEIGHRTVTIGHLINITREVARPIRWDPVKEQIVDDPEANALLDRPRRKGWELPDLS